MGNVKKVFNLMHLKFAISSDHYYCFINYDRQKSIFLTVLNFGSVSKNNNNIDATLIAKIMSKSSRFMIIIVFLFVCIFFVTKKWPDYELTLSDRLPKKNDCDKAGNSGFYIF